MKTKIVFISIIRNYNTQIVYSVPIKKKNETQAYRLIYTPKILFIYLRKNMTTN